MHTRYRTQFGFASFRLFENPELQAEPEIFRGRRPFTPLARDVLAFVGEVARPPHLANAFSTTICTSRDTTVIASSIADSRLSERSPGERFG
jgi:hypothetical protein